MDCIKHFVARRIVIDHSSLIKIFIDRITEPNHNLERYTQSKYIEYYEMDCKYHFSKSLKICVKNRFAFMWTKRRIKIINNGREIIWLRENERNLMFFPFSFTTIYR